MDVFAAILTCSLHSDDALVRAIVDNAHANPFAVLTPELDASAAAPAPASYEGAVAQLHDASVHGLRPLLGLMQVPAEWAEMFGRVPEDLLEPCVNVSIGTAMLSAFDYACTHTAKRAQATAPSATRRTCVARRYALAIGMPDLETVVTLELRTHPGDLVEPTSAPIFPSLRLERTWGADRLLVGAFTAPHGADTRQASPRAQP
jgi:hypothetical protein